MRNRISFRVLMLVLVISVVSNSLSAQQRAPVRSKEPNGTTNGTDKIKIAAYYRVNTIGYLPCYFKRLGNDIYWYAEVSGVIGYSFVFKGTLKDDIISGNWWYVPKEKMSNPNWKSTGSVKLKVKKNGDELEVMSSAKDFPFFSTSMKKIEFNKSEQGLFKARNVSALGDKVDGITGIWETNYNTVIYVRQYQNTIVGFEESKDFKAGKKPKFAGIIFGEIEGNVLNVRIMDIAKGEFPRNSNVKFKLDDAAVMKRISSHGDINDWFWSKATRKLPPLKLPLFDVMNALEGPFFNRLEMYLDDYRGNGHAGAWSYIYFKGNKIDSFQIGKLYETLAQRWHLNDMKSVGFDLRPDPSGDPAKWIISAEFEDKDREIVCITRVSDKRDEASSGHIIHPQADVYLKLVNKGDFFTYEVNKVSWKGKVDLIITLAGLIDKAIDKKARPKIEQRVISSMNSSEMKLSFNGSLKKYITGTNTQFKNYFAKIGLKAPQIKKIQIQGKNLVVHFN